VSAAVEGPPPLVYSPRSLAEALALFVPNPQAQLFAGGTAWQTEHLSTSIRLAPVTISLHLAEDLRKVTYGERFVDLGGNLSLNQLLAVGGNWLPDILKDAARVIGTSALRNLATVGGNLCQKGILGDLFPVFHLLAAQFEVRSLRGSRWIPAQAAADAGRILLSPGEILTRVRIPVDGWTLGFYQKIGNIRTPWDERLALAALAKIKDGQLEALRLSFHLPHAGLLRVRDLEAELAGQGLPLSHRERTRALERIDEALGALAVLASPFQRDRVLHMTRWVLTRLEDE
jgi:CO/xanthine dehydrogenase FAD-binding subunit